MKTRWVILFLLLVPIVSLFHSCWGCDPPAPASYSHKTLLLKNLDNSGERVIETETLQINKDAYGIRLYIVTEESIIARAKQTNSVFIQPVYATSVPDCYRYIYSAIDSIVSINIFTLNDFDNQHSENTNITDYFKIRQTYSSVEEYVKKISYTYECDEFKTLSWKDLIIDLMLMIAPTTTNNQQFKIQVKLSDGRILEQQTTEIELL
jgi:hypothetical protein